MLFILLYKYNHSYFSNKISLEKEQGEANIVAHALQQKENEQIQFLTMVVVFIVGED